MNAMTKHRGLTFRGRLALTYSALLTAVGITMLVLLYGFMRFVPTYSIRSTEPADTSGSSGVTRAYPLTQAETDSYAAGESMPAISSTLNLSSAADILDTLLIVGAVALVLLVLIGAGVGWIIAGRMVRPLAEINDAAILAGTGSFDHRVDFSGPDDEIKHLADTFDGMLERLHTSFERQRQFAANASHELRTPLATTRTMLDVARSDPSLDRDALLELASRLHATNERSIEIVEALLDLSDVGSRPVRQEPIDVADLVAEIVESAADSIEARHLVVTLSLDPARTTADPALLRQVVRNLIHNSVQHNIDHGWIHIATRADPDDVQLSISNSGETVPTEQLDHLAEPFATGGSRVRSQAAGHGLGLALVSSIVQAHDGSLTLAANPGGGLAVSVQFASHHDGGAHPLEDNCPAHHTAAQ